MNQIGPGSGIGYLQPLRSPRSTEVPPANSSDRNSIGDNHPSELLNNNSPENNIGTFFVVDHHGFQVH